VRKFTSEKYKIEISERLEGGEAMAERQLFTAPDTGVIESILYLYNPNASDSGAVAVTIVPGVLLNRPTLVVETDRLKITFYLDRANNLAEVILTRQVEPVTVSRQTFFLTKEFVFKPEVTLTVLFASWDIVALIDGKPLTMREIE
jgi:hypothetical protein